MRSHKNEVILNEGHWLLLYVTYYSNYYWTWLSVSYRCDVVNYLHCILFFYSLCYFLGIVHPYQAFLSVIQCLQKVDGLCWISTVQSWYVQLLTLWYIGIFTFYIYLYLLHFAWVVDDAKCIVVTRVCVCLCVCLSVGVCVCPRPYAHTTARTRM